MGDLGYVGSVDLPFFFSMTSIFRNLVNLGQFDRWWDHCQSGSGSLEPAFAQSLSFGLATLPQMNIPAHLQSTQNHVGVLLNSEYPVAQH